MKNHLEALEPFLVGQLVYVTSGAYSDFDVQAIGRVIKDFLAQDFATTKSSYYGDQNNLDYERLTREGFIEEVVARELWIGE